MLLTQVEGMDSHIASFDYRNAGNLRVFILCGEQRRSIYSRDA
jgi:hypothetical protein